MAILFRNPVLKRIEDALWRKAQSEIQGRIASGDLEPGKLRREAKALFKGLWAEERKLAKIALKTYKQLAPDKTEQAVALTIEHSRPAWYSVEIVEDDDPVICAVPLNVFKSHVAYLLDRLLRAHIEFANLASEARAAFAEHSAEAHVDSVVKDAIKERAEFKCELFKFRKVARIVDVLRQDYYFLGDDEHASQIDMLVLSREDHGHWKRTLDDVAARPQGRRFTIEAAVSWRGVLDSLGER